MTDIIKTDKRKLLLYIILFAALTRLAIGAFVTNTFDLFWYRTWILDIKNGLFNIYSRADEISLDYPPLFLILVYPISLLYKIIAPDTYQMADMLFLKLIPIVFDVLSAYLIFKISENDEKCGLFAAILWLLNPSVFFNSTIWGQTDSVLSFFILLTFYFLFNKRPVISTVIFACSCMIKFQCAFLAPIFLLGIFDILSERKLREFLYCILAGVITVAAVFVPFSVGAGKPTLIFDVYFGSTGSYPYCSVNAGNLYALLGLNWQTHDTEFIFGLSFAAFGYIMLILGIVFLFFAWFKGKNKCIYFSAVFLMQHIFIFMTDMHERYQFIILPLILIVWAIYKNKNYLRMFAAYTVVTLANQWVVLADFTKRPTPWQGHLDLLLLIIGGLNVLLYLWTTYEFIKFSFNEKI